MKTWFERAIFLSWYCSKADCAFCYMSTQKDKIKLKNPKLARRRIESILAEVLICKKLGWKIEFLSGGYESFTLDELVEIAKNVKKVYGEKVWLNIGTLNEDELRQFIPYTVGVSGAVECINMQLRKKICPSKSIEDIIVMYKAADKVGLKKSITIIIGLGETEKDIPKLIDFIKEYKIDKITLYALNPHKGTIYKKGPETKYYVKWIKAVRKEFPEMHIVAGSWVNRLKEIHELLNAGATAITKFPSIRLFNSKYARQIEEEVKKANMEFIGTMTKLPKLNINKEVDILQLEKDLKVKIKQKLNNYLKTMRR